MIPNYGYRGECGWSLVEAAAGGITCLAACDSPEDQEDSKPTLLGAPLISRKHIHPHPVRWLAPWLGQLPGERWRHRQSTCWPPGTPLSPKHHLSMNVHVHLDTYAKRAGSSLSSLPPGMQFGSICQTWISNRKGAAGGRPSSIFREISG